MRFSICEEAYENVVFNMPAIFQTSLFQIFYSGESFHESISRNYESLQFVFTFFIFIGTTCFFFVS